MISYIRLYGPPVYDAIKELEKIAIDMPEVCIMDTIFASSLHNFGGDRGVGSADGDRVVGDYFMDVGEISRERCSTIISRSGQKLGEYDFYFEWFRKPSMDELNGLIKKIDAALKPLGTRYTITTS